MTLRKKGPYYYGDSIADLREEMIRYSHANGYEATLFWEPRCPQLAHHVTNAHQGARFHITYSEDEGGASLSCADCHETSHLADSAQYSPDDFDCSSGCYCDEDAEHGDVLVGAATYLDGTDALRWFYVGWRAPCCGLLGIYVDWKYDGSMPWREVLETWGQHPQS